MTLDFEAEITTEAAAVREGYEIDGTTFDFDITNPLLNIGETGRLLIRVTNDYPDEIKVESLDIHIPPELEYVSMGHLRFNYVNASGNRSSIVWYSDRISKINNNLLRWDGTISEGDSKLFILKLRAKRTSHPIVQVNTKYEYDNTEFEDTLQETLAVSDPGIGIRMSVEDKSRRFAAPERLDREDDSIELEAFHPYHFTVYIQNTNKYAKIESADVRVYTDLAQFTTRHYPMIEEEGQVIPYSVELIPPQVESNTNFKMNISVAYENEFGEHHENSTEFTVTVVPSKDLTIEWESSEGEVLEGGEETEIKVTITNDRLVDLNNVYVRETIPEELHVEGVHSKKIKLNKETDTEVYTYRLTPPVVHNKTRYEIVTTVSFFDQDKRQNFNLSKTTVLTIEPLRPDISIDITLDEPDTVYAGASIPVEYSITNDEENEIVRDLTVSFPIQEEFDHIGPRTFFIDKLDPGETITLKNLVRIRPKIGGNRLKLDKTVVRYYDNYGNEFHENSTEETVDVEKGLTSGPAIFLTTIAPEIINKSTETPIKIKLENKGGTDADVTVQQWDREWNVTMPAYSAKTIEYKIRYDNEGNYTIPPPQAVVRSQDVEAYTAGKGAEARVELILGPAEEVVKEEEAVKQVTEEIEMEKEEMSFEEYETKVAAERMRKITKYSLVGLVAIILLLIVVGFIYYEKRKGPSQPFIELEQK